MADIQLTMADFAQGGGALGLPGVTTNTPTPAGYSATPTAAAGATGLTNTGSATAQMAGLFGAILTPFSQAFADKISGKYEQPIYANAPGTVTGSGTNWGGILLALGIGVGVLILALVLIRRA